MKSPMKFLMAALLGVALSLTSNGAASAAPIVGADGFASIGTFAIPGGSNIATSTSLNSTFVISTNTGTGDYSAIPSGTLFGSQTLVWASVPVAGGYTLTLTMAGPPGTAFGTFVSSGGVIVSRTALAFEVDFIGTFTPGPGIPGVGPNSSTTLIVTGNDATGLGKAITESLSLTSPPPRPTPEPSTLVLACLAGVPFSVGRFRRWGRKTASQEPLTV